MSLKDFFRKLFKKKDKKKCSCENCTCQHNEPVEEVKEETTATDIVVEKKEDTKEVPETVVVDEPLPPIIEVVTPEQVKTVEVEPEMEFPLLSQMTVAELRDLCRGRGISGYSTKKKDELIPFIYSTLTVPDLKAICKFRAISGYSTKKKEELIEMIISAEK